MKVRKVISVYFSPCGHTREAVCLTARETGALLGVPAEEISLTYPQERTGEKYFSGDELVFVGTPTYAGRVPNKIAPELARLLHGKDTPVVPVVTFGNRSYDNSLAELASILEKNGFCPVGAAAICMPHVFSDTIGTGHPDGRDREKIKELARSAADFLSDSAEAAGRNLRLCLPGKPDAPYYTPLGADGKPAKFLKAHPVLNAGRCTGCGTCAEVCPLGSVSRSDPAAMTGICIKCQACIRSCPAQARYFEDPAFLSHVEMLEQTYARPAFSEIFCRNGRGGGQAAAADGEKGKSFV